MTYEESAQLMTDMQFRGRVKVACLKYAKDIISGGTGGPGQQSRQKWAQRLFAQPDMVVAEVTPVTVMQDAVQGVGGSVDDGALQFAVNNAVDTMV